MPELTRARVRAGCKEDLLQLVQVRNVEEIEPGRCQKWELERLLIYKKRT